MPRTRSPRSRCAKRCGLPREACLQALREFAGLPHRSQWVADMRGVRYVNDSKGTNVGATLAAVAGMPGSLVLIAGGQGKGQDFAPLRAGVSRQGAARRADRSGREGDRARAARRVDHRIRTRHGRSGAARGERGTAGETVLLSPACASLDMFRDYAHRGDVFAAAVRRLQP